MKQRLCMNGRECGKGKVPECPNYAIHQIASPGCFPILLCENCFQVAVMLGLVSEPCIGKQEFDRRELERTSQN